MGRGVLWCAARRPTPGADPARGRQPVWWSAGAVSGTDGQPHPTYTRARTCGQEGSASGGRQPWYVYFIGPAPLATRAEPPHRCQAGESRRYDAQETFPKGSTWRVTSPDAHRKTGQEKLDFNAPSIMAWGKPCTRRAEATGPSGHRASPNVWVEDWAMTRIAVSFYRFMGRGNEYTPVPCPTNARPFLP